MNSTDLHTLLTNPPVSRATFFTQLLAQPGHQAQGEKPREHPAADTPAEPLAPPAADAEQAGPGFPA